MLGLWEWSQDDMDTLELLLTQFGKFLCDLFIQNPLFWICGLVDQGNNYGFFMIKFSFLESICSSHNTHIFFLEGG